MQFVTRIQEIYLIFDISLRKNWYIILINKCRTCLRHGVYEGGKRENVSESYFKACIIVLHVLKLCFLALKKTRSSLFPVNKVRGKTAAELTFRNLVSYI